MADIAFRVRCSGERHRIVLHEDGTASYQHHEDIDELVSEARRPALLAVLAGLSQPEIQLDGCALVCAGIQADVRVAHYPDSGVRGLFAARAGRKLGARLRGRCALGLCTAHQAKGRCELEAGHDGLHTAHSHTWK